MPLWLQHGPTCESGIAVVDRSHIGDSGSPNCRTQRDHVCVRAAHTHTHTHTHTYTPPSSFHHPLPSNRFALQHSPFFKRTRITSSPRSRPQTTRRCQRPLVLHALAHRAHPADPCTRLGRSMRCCPRTTAVYACKAQRRCSGGSCRARARTAAVHGHSRDYSPHASTIGALARQGPQ